MKPCEKLSHHRFDCMHPAWPCIRSMGPSKPSCPFLGCLSCARYVQPPSICRHSFAGNQMGPHWNPAMTCVAERRLEMPALAAVLCHISVVTWQPHPVSSFFSLATTAVG